MAISNADLMKFLLKIEAMITNADKRIDMIQVPIIDTKEIESIVNGLYITNDNTNRRIDSLNLTLKATLIVLDKINAKKYPKAKDIDLNPIIDNFKQIEELIRSDNTYDKVTSMNHDLSLILNDINKSIIKLKETHIERVIEPDEEINIISVMKDDELIIPNFHIGEPLNLSFHSPSIEKGDKIKLIFIDKGENNSYEWEGKVDDNVVTFKVESKDTMVLRDSPHKFKVVKMGSDYGILSKGTFNVLT